MDSAWPAPSQLDASENERALEEVRESIAEGPMVLANLSVFCDVGAIFCSDPVLQSIVHFTCCAVIGSDYEAFHGGKSKHYLANGSKS